MQEIPQTCERRKDGQKVKPSGIEEHYVHNAEHPVQWKKDGGNKTLVKAFF